MDLTNDTMGIRIRIATPDDPDGKREEMLRKWADLKYVPIRKAVLRRKEKGRPFRSWPDFIFAVANSTSDLSNGLPSLTDEGMEERVMTEVLGPITSLEPSLLG